MSVDPAVLKTAVDRTWRDFEVDGVPASGAHEPIKAEIRSSLAGVVDLAADARAIASVAGTTLVMQTRAQLNALPGPFIEGARAEVRADPAGNVINGNGVYRYSGTAWVWIDRIIPQDIQNEIIAEAVAETSAETDQKVGGLAQYVNDLVRPYDDQYIALGDEGGFERRLLTPEVLDLPCGNIETTSFSLIAEGDGFRVADDYGFVGFVVGEQVLPDVIESRDLLIYSDPRVVLSVRDENGYCPVFVPLGRSLGPTDQLEADVRFLMEGGGAGGGRAWPRIQAAGVAVSAHRGVWEGTAAPENSLDGLRLAARLGYRHPETDIRRTSDGQFVVMHDDTINRTMRLEDGQTVIPAPVVIADNTLAQLRSGYVLASTDPAMRRSIPTFDEYLRLAKTLGVMPILEIKDETLTNPQIEALVMQAVEVLGWGGLIFTSFYQNILDHIRTLNADVVLYYILHFNSANIDHVASKRGVFNTSAALLTDALVKEAHRKGVRVACWTVAPNDFDDFVALGVDELTSNHIAPRLEDQAIAWSIHSGPSWSGWSTTGSEAEGVIHLETGQVLTLDVSTAPSVEMGGWYLSLEFSGEARVTASGVNTGLRNHPEMATRCFQNRMTGAPFLTVTAGPSGAQIKTAAFAVASF